MKWRCLICGYIHEGDKPPEKCPVCGADSSKFVRVEENEAAAQSGKAEPAPVEKLTPEEAVIQAVRVISYGLFIVTTNFEGRDNGQTANTCFQITSEPVQIAVGLNKKNLTNELISKSGIFGVSILDQSGRDLVARFGYRSGRDGDKFEGLKAHRGQSGILLPDEVLATLEAKVVGTMDAGTHTLFLAKVTAAEVLRRTEPMTYAYFRSHK